MSSAAHWGVMSCHIAMGISLPWSAQPDWRERVTLRVTLNGGGNVTFAIPARCIVPLRQGVWQWPLSDGVNPRSGGCCATQTASWLDKMGGILCRPKSCE